MQLTAIFKSAGHAPKGGIVASANGAFYKGGQFLPSTDQPPGTWKVGNKVLGTGNELVSPGVIARQPTPLSRSIFAMVRGWTVEQDGKLALHPGALASGSIKPDEKMTPGVKGFMGKTSYTMQELLDHYNSGKRWLNVDVDVPADKIKKKTEWVTKFNAYHDAKGLFAASGEGDQGSDMEQQVAWFEAKAKAFGYDSADDFAAKNPDAFNEMAGHWRKTHTIKSFELALKGFSKDQPRDEDGKWTHTGVGGQGKLVTAGVFQGVSFGVHWGELGLDLPSGFTPENDRLRVAFYGSPEAAAYRMHTNPTKEKERIAQQEYYEKNKEAIKAAQQAKEKEKRDAQEDYDARVLQHEDSMAAKLTDTEKEVLSDYSWHGFGSLNAHLRGSSLTAEQAAAIRPVAELDAMTATLDSAIGKSTVGPLVVHPKHYQGGGGETVRPLYRAIAGMELPEKVGSLIVDKAYSSTTANHLVAEKILSSYDTDGFIMEIVTTPSTRGLPMGKIGVLKGKDSEEEFLLPRNTTYRVVEVRPTNSLQPKRVVVEVVEPSTKAEKTYILVSTAPQRQGYLDSVTTTVKSFDLALKGFNEAQHPRDKEGQFTDAGGSLNDAIDATIADLNKEKAAWQAKNYKPNKKVVSLQGDGPKKSGLMNIGAINAQRRDRAIANLSEQVSALTKLKDVPLTDLMGTMDEAKRLADLSFYSAVKLSMRDSRGKQIVLTADQHFEGELHDALIDPKGGFAYGSAATKALRVAYTAQKAKDAAKALALAKAKEQEPELTFDTSNSDWLKQLFPVAKTSEGAEELTGGATMATVSHMDRTLKLSGDEQRIVWGEVYIPNVPDSDNDFMDAVGVRDMAYKFMKNLKLKMIDSSHNNQEVEGACVVESFIARKGDPDFVEGAWVAAVYIPDDATWSRVKKGELNGFSMEALVSKTPTELELDVPQSITGLTINGDDGHTHEFQVSYDEAGTFLGGRTDIKNGHFHVIKRGSVTEEAGGHRHKFAHVDGMGGLNELL